MAETREPAIRMIAMPADANPSGDIFGGYIMSLIDRPTAPPPNVAPCGRAVGRRGRDLCAPGQTL